MNESSRWNFNFGFLDETIRCFAGRNREIFHSRSALVTCVDSSPKPGRAEGWTRLLLENDVKFELIADFVWIPASQLTNALESQAVFPGFSEIYLVQGKPESVSGIVERFTSDGADFSEALPEEVAIQMQSIGADGYLSDGCGLNFVLGYELSNLLFQGKSSRNEQQKRVRF